MHLAMHSLKISTSTKAPVRSDQQSGGSNTSMMWHSTQKASSSWNSSSNMATIKFRLWHQPTLGLRHEQAISTLQRESMNFLQVSASEALPGLVRQTSSMICLMSSLSLLLSTSPAQQFVLPRPCLSDTSVDLVLSSKDIDSFSSSAYQLKESLDMRDNVERSCFSLVIIISFCFSTLDKFYHTSFLSFFGGSQQRNFHKLSYYLGVIPFYRRPFLISSHILFFSVIESDFHFFFDSLASILSHLA